MGSDVLVLSIESCKTELGVGMYTVNPETHGKRFNLRLILPKTPNRGLGQPLH